MVDKDSEFSLERALLARAQTSKNCFNIIFQKYGRELTEDERGCEINFDSLESTEKGISQHIKRKSFFEDNIASNCIESESDDVIITGEEMSHEAVSQLHEKVLRMKQEMDWPDDSVSGGTPLEDTDAECIEIFDSCSETEESDFDESFQALTPVAAQNISEICLNFSPCSTPRSPRRVKKSAVRRRRSLTEPPKHLNSHHIQCYHPDHHASMCVDNYPSPLHKYPDISYSCTSCCCPVYGQCTRENSSHTSSYFSYPIYHQPDLCHAHQVYLPSTPVGLIEHDPEDPLCVASPSSGFVQTYDSPQTPMIDRAEFPSVSTTPRSSKRPRQDASFYSKEHISKRLCL